MSFLFFQRLCLPVHWSGPSFENRRNTLALCPFGSGKINFFFERAFQQSVFLLCFLVTHSISVFPCNAFSALPDLSMAFSEDQHFLIASSSGFRILRFPFFDPCLMGSFLTFLCAFSSHIGKKNRFENLPDVDLFFFDPIQTTRRPNIFFNLLFV